LVLNSEYSEIYGKDEKKGQQKKGPLRTLTLGRPSARNWPLLAFIALPPVSLLGRVRDGCAEARPILSSTL